MSRWRSVWLVAKREIIERGRSRGFIFSVFFTTLLVVGSFVVPTLLFGDEDTTMIGIVEPAPPGLDAAIAATAAQVDATGRGRRRIADAPAADAALEAETVDAVADRPGRTCRRRARSGSPRSPIRSRPRSCRRPSSRCGCRPSWPSRASTQAALAGGPGRRRTVESLDPQTEADESRFLFANIGAVLILVGIFSFGFTVLTGVVEEKQSRVVEVVLSTVRPRDLLMGKVLGIGILGLVQLLVFVVAALAAAVAHGPVHAARDDARMRSRCSSSGSSSATRCTRRRSGSWARSRRAWRRRRTRRRR